MRNWQIAAQIFHRALAPIPSIGRQYAVDSCSLHSEPMLLRTCSKIGSAIEEICLGLRARTNRGEGFARCHHQFECNISFKDLDIFAY
jgi:hypothetical protein